MVVNHVFAQRICELDCGAFKGCLENRTDVAWYAAWRFADAAATAPSSSIVEFVRSRTIVSLRDLVSRAQCSVVASVLRKRGVFAALSLCSEELLGSVRLSRCVLSALLDPC